MNLAIDSERLHAEIEELAAISEAEAPAVTRILFTPADLKARAWMIERCKAAGLAVRQDAIGNTFARWNGSDPKAPVVGTGSHIDAIPNAGKYDGVVGVLGGLEAIRALQARRIPPEELDRAAGSYFGRADALWNRMPRQPAALRDSFSGSRQKADR